jgi:hypothetical protein
MFRTLKVERSQKFVGATRSLKLIDHQINQTERKFA